MSEQQKLEEAIRAIDAQRRVLGDALADASLAPLRARLSTLRPEGGGLEAPVLKQVTVLFLDVVDSTTISQLLDSEDTKAVLDGALARFRFVVGSFKGRVLACAGDSVLAVFGADETLEDDAEQAVRAGLALTHAARAYGESIRDDYGVREFSARVGVHTGSALVETRDDGDVLVHGLAINIASRMEQSAPSGRVRISDETYRHVRGIFDVELQAPLAFKGLDQPMTTYLVVRAKPRAFRVPTRGIDGVETRMIGRDAELRVLQVAFDRLYREPTFALISIVAEAGIGKSRLLYEFENWAESSKEDFYLFRGRADPQTRGKPYGLLRDILMWRLEIGEMDSMHDAKQRFESRLRPLLPDDDGLMETEAEVHSLGQLIGFDFSDSPHLVEGASESEQIRYRGFHAAVRMFRGFAQNGRPIVMLLEDLHWADAASLEFLSHLAEVNHDVPILLLGLTRPQLFEGEHAWPTPAHSQRIDLKPLDKALSRTLVDEMLKKLEKVPGTLREAIIGSAEGNPFYMEELIRVLIDEGAIRTTGPVWAVEPERLLAMKLPSTLAGVLQARLDGLPPAERRALQCAAIIGTIFWSDGLGAIDADAVDALPALVRRGLIQKSTNVDVPGTQEYVFSHHLLQSAVYETLTKRKRREVHARFARWLVSRADAGGTSTIGVAANHFERAGDMKNACELYAVAAEQAQGVYAHDVALEYATRALSAVDRRADRQADLVRWRLLNVRERTLDILGKRAEQRTVIDALAKLAETLDDDGLRGEVAWCLCDFSWWISDFVAMESHARSTIRWAERSERPELRLKAEQRLALAFNKSGRILVAREMATRGVEESRRRQLRTTETGFRTALSIIDAGAGNLEKRLFEVRKSIAVYRISGNVRAQARAQINACVQLIGFGDYPAAEAHAKQAMELLGSIGELPTRPYALNNLSIIACRTADYESALSHAEAALEIATRVGQAATQIWSHCCAGEARLAMKDLRLAAHSFDAAYRLANRTGDPQHLDAAAGHARVALALDDLAAASRWIEPIFDHWETNGHFDGTEAPFAIYLTCVRTLQRRSDRRALPLLERAYQTMRKQIDATSDERLRHGLSNNVHEYREITAAWAARPAVEARGA